MSRCSLNKGLVLIVLISVIISGCGSFQVDITPEPDEVDNTATPQPTLAPTEPPATLSPDELGSEAIVVTVIDQTGGALLEQGLVVELAGYEDFELVYEDAVNLSSRNQVVFKDVPLPAGRVYFASISLSGAVYRSEIVEVDPETSLLELTIPVFDTTTNAEGLIIDRVHLLVDFPAPGFAQVVEIFIMSNVGDATVVSANPGDATVSFPLPEGAESIEFENGALGQRYLETEDGFGDTVSIPPGSGVYQVLVYYTLPVQRNKINFSQEMNYPVQAVVVMTPAGEAVIKGSTLEDGGVQAIPNGSVQLYSGAALARGESLDFRLTIESGDNTLPADGTGFLSQGVILGLGLLGGVIFAVGVWLFLRQRGANLEQGEEVSLGEDREQILDSIIALEDLYQDGEIEEKDYLKKRQEYKEKLETLDEGEE
jgi:hypothetical protein